MLNDMLLDRSLILIVALAATGILVFAWRLYLQYRFTGVSEHQLPPELAHFSSTGRPAVLYFTTKNCALCRFQQTPILGQLAAQTGIPVHTVDAVEQERLAHYFGVMTVPTTVFLDGDMRPASINHGLTRLPRLHQQLARIANV